MINIDYKRVKALFSCINKSTFRTFKDLKRPGYLVMLMHEKVASAESVIPHRPKTLNLKSTLSLITWTVVIIASYSQRPLTPTEYRIHI
jgi:hypothetical protein